MSFLPAASHAGAGRAQARRCSRSPFGSPLIRVPVAAKTALVTAVAIAQHLEQRLLRVDLKQYWPEASLERRQALRR